MNNPSPLIPQGTSPDRGKSNLYFKILIIVSVHVVLIGGMLLQGCKDNKSGAGSETASTTPDASNDLTSLPPVNTNYTPAPTPPMGSNVYGTLPSTPIGGTNPGFAQTPAPIPTPVPTPTPVSEGTEYVVARGDTLAVIAKKNGVSLKALKEANPGVDPRKLKIGQKVQIPGGGSSTGMAGGATGVGGAADTGDTTIYVVKSGDMLGRIAKAHGTTVAKLKALNDLKTSSIKVGQKLKLPAPKMAMEAAPAPAPVVTPAPMPSAYATTSQPAVGTH